MSLLPSRAMASLIRAFTGSTFVQKEVLSKLPLSVRIKFTPEFNENGDLIIFISSPDYPGIISEAKTMDEAFANAHDAILTYFDVPRACANAIKFDVVEKQRPSKTNISSEDSSAVLVKDFKLKQMANA